MLEQLDIFSAIAQAQAEAEAQRKLPVRDRFKVGDFVQGRFQKGDPIKRGRIESFTMSELLLIRQLSGKQAMISPEFSEVLDALAQAEAEAEFRALVGESAVAPQPESAPEPEDKWREFKVGDRVIYTVTIPWRDRKEVRTLTGTIEAFDDKIWTSPTAMVRIAEQGPLYPCGLTNLALSEGGDRDG